jgi:hypothetical protein
MCPQNKYYQMRSLLRLLFSNVLSIKRDYFPSKENSGEVMNIWTVLKEANIFLLKVNAIQDIYMWAGTASVV